MLSSVSIINPSYCFTILPQIKKNSSRLSGTSMNPLVVIINEPNTVEIFNGLSYLSEEKTLEKLEDASELNNFSYFELVTGKTWQNYKKISLTRIGLITSYWKT